jgi:hypothetical protein
LFTVIVTNYKNPIQFKWKSKQLIAKDYIA